MKYIKRYEEKGTSWFDYKYKKGDYVKLHNNDGRVFEIVNGSFGWDNIPKYELKQIKVENGEFVWDNNVRRSPKDPNDLQTGAYSIWVPEKDIIKILPEEIELYIAAKKYNI